MNRLLELTRRKISYFPALGILEQDKIWAVIYLLLVGFKYVVDGRRLENAPREYVRQQGRGLMN